MHPDDAVEVTIWNHRPRRGSSLGVLVPVAVFLLGLCGLCTLDLGLTWGALWATGTAAALVGAVALALVAEHPIVKLKLSTALVLRPGGTEYRPDEIVRIEFGADPQEDYRDTPIPVRLCEIRVLPLQQRPIVLVSSVGDAIRLREWAIRKCVRVADPQDSLADGCRTATTGTLEPMPDAEPNRQ